MFCMMHNAVFFYCNIAECLIKYQACFGKIWAAKGKEFILHTLISLSLAPQMLLQDLYVDLVAISCWRSACCLLHIDSVHKSKSNANIDLMLISKSLHSVSNYLSRGSRLPDSSIQTLGSISKAIFVPACCKKAMFLNQYAKT